MSDSHLDHHQNHLSVPSSQHTPSSISSQSPHRQKRWAISIVFLSLLGILIATGAQAFAADEFRGYAVEKFRGASKGECDSSNLTWTIEQVNNFKKKFNTWDSWEYINTFTNKGVDGRDFTDPTKASSCYCSDYQPSCACTGDDNKNTYGADDADVVVISTHGSHKNTYFGLTMGDYDNDCFVTSQNNMYWNEDTDILILEACQGLQRSVFQNSNATDRSGFFKMLPASSQLRMVLGYHGNTLDRKSTWDAPGFVKNSRYNDIGPNWIAYMQDWSRPGKHICPTALVFGETSSKRQSMYEHGGFQDRKDTGKKTGATYWYLPGCNPKSGVTLPE